jgi:RHH-type proline utilization regulon transcriptional repressor/proline dehydrogenase/delta 1-pyrroline-5-carboxylate dehydrogenase
VRMTQRYYQSYEQAIHAIGKASAGRGIYEGPGISIKLSALHPRYSRAQFDRVMKELYPLVLRLTVLAKQYDIGLNIDAEETDRLELSLDLLERLCHEPTLAGWNGIGFVIQAYQKRCPFVIDYVVDLARRTQRPPDGAPGQRRVLGQRNQARPGRWPGRLPRLHPQGAHRHFVHRLRKEAAGRARGRVPPVRHPQRRNAGHHLPLAGSNYYAGQYEFQCLHGMGEPLYEQVVGAITAGKLAETQERAAWAARAASTPPWARTKPCWPTWCAACWKTAPTPRS